MNLVSALESAAHAAGALKTAAFPVGIIAAITELALKAGIGFAKAGKDPVGEIERILSAEPEVKKVHDEWDNRLDDKFGEVKTPDTQPSPESGVGETD